MPYLMYIKVKVFSVKHFLFGQSTPSDAAAFCARRNEGKSFLWENHITFSADKRAHESTRFIFLLPCDRCII